MIVFTIQTDKNVKVIYARNGFNLLYLYNSKSFYVNDCDNGECRFLVRANEDDLNNYVKFAIEIFNVSLNNVKKKKAFDISKFFQLYWMHFGFLRVK